MTRTFLRATAWLAGILAMLAALGWGYYLSLDLDSIPKANQHATTAGLPYLKQAVNEKRGRILAIVSSAERGGPLSKKAGYELTELSRAYYAFKVNGYEVDIASPLGGRPPASIDTDDLQDLDYAFLNDAEAQAKASQSLPLARVDTARYDAVYVVGGKGAMFDLPGNRDVARIVLDVAQRGVVGAVCHGPAALLDVAMADGKPFVAGKRMTGFTNDEELFLDANARARFPFLLQDRALDRGARFVSAPNYLDNTVVDGRLVTGQNSWSTWSTVEAMIKALGHAPVAREPGPDENSVRMLAAYQRGGLAAARAEQASVPQFDKMLVLMHALVAAMEWRLADAFQLQRLANR
ncbi:type 1 glutamine amidotransferase domain-containing protein [Massilia sp. RP-1-19]|uniref:Type 1 glutamine amidotransferase domain-containing protein n=1 Tax=Massilia polaris TaxID=2728846 RepID=A0A848HH56_9BURK|nr:type 1 glutamine amidotransferase domain-containing protein [Massilia polaris]NML60397.1 type 1 glutamine amidotransferase domain-containing protein [Massilia polaris]